MLKSSGKLVPLLLATSLIACQPSGSSSVEPPVDPPPGEHAGLYDLEAVSRPEFPVLSAPSQDGEHIFQVHGTQIVVLSTARVKACADGGTCDLDTLNTDDFGASLSRTDLDVSILDIEERDGFLYVAGGDYGFLILQPNQNDGYHNGYTEIFRATSTPGTASTSRWCMDVDAQGGAILAVFGALDDSELRVYSPTLPAVLLATYALTPAQGVPHGAQAMAVERDGSMAYLAMGNAGIWRVDRSKDPALPAAQWLAQGPLNPAAGCSTNSIPPYHFVHDIAVVNVDGATRYLYAGADGWGLVEIDLALDWSADMPFWSGNPTCYWASLPETNCSGVQSNYLFAQRVTAVYDPAHQEIVVAASFPQSGTNNLTTPYTSYGSLSWDFGHVNPVDFSQSACSDDYRVFTRPAGVPVETPSESLLARYAPGVFFATPLHLLASPDGKDFWLLDAALQTVHLERQPAQLAPAGSANCGVFAYMSAPITPQASLIHPDVMISGVDGAQTCDEQNTLFRVDPGPGKPTFVPIHSVPGDGTRFFLGAFGTAQWIDGTDASQEFLLRGKGFQLAECSTLPPIQCPGDEGPNLFRIDASSESSLQGLKRIRTLWSPDPAAPPSGSGNAWTYSAGRGYSFTTVDDRPQSRLVVETRGGIVHGAWLFDRDDLQTQAHAVPDGGLIVAAQVPLITHGTDEIAQDEYGDIGVYLDRITKCKTMEPRFFDVADSSGADLRVLGIASGYSVADTQAAGTTFGRPQVTFFDVTDVLTLPAQPPTPVVLRSKTSIPEAAAVCLDAQTVMLKDPTQPWIKRPHTLVFVGGSEGFLSVFDVSTLYSAQTYTEVSADLEPNVFDQHGDVIFQVDFRPDVTGESLGHLHVGALRRGMIRLAVHDAGNGSVSLTNAGAVNTPGSFGGFQILTVNGKERMIVADHTFYGLRAYGDY